MIEIKNYCPELEQAHFEFASKMFGERRKRRNSDYIYWKFRGVQGKELKSFKLAIIENKVIGQFGVIPCTLNIDGKSINAQWACDLMVDAAYRGKGIAKMLYDAAHKERILTLGSNPSPAAQISMTSNGYKQLKSSEAYFIPIYMSIPLQMKGLHLRFLNGVKNPFLRLYRKSSIINLFEEIDIDELSHDKIFRRSAKRALNIEIDHEFKNWRFKQFKDYYPGIKAYKLRNKETYFSGYFNGRTYFITDCYVSDVVDYNLIVAFILKINEKNKLELIRFMNNDTSLVFSRLKLILIKYSTPNSIIYYTKDKTINKMMENRTFYYTYQDSDENI
jgi:GNAT superfamily N-acetyltransferase